MLPEVLYRTDDNEEFVLVKGKYQNAKSEMYKPHRYTYDMLIRTGMFSEYKQNLAN